MYLKFNIDDFEQHYLMFDNPVKNTIMNNSTYNNILYSTETFTLNGVTIQFSLKNVVYEPYFNKYKCSFSTEQNNEVIEKLSHIEKSILQEFSTKKLHVLGLSEQVNRKQLKVFEHVKTGNSSKIITKRRVNTRIMVKISGVWEKDNKIGIIYKFLVIN